MDIVNKKGAGGRTDLHISPNRALKAQQVLLLLEEDLVMVRKKPKKKKSNARPAALP
jgi:hypothetical protein